jgi:hypothetical protein
MNSICHSQLKAYSTATQSCPPPPPWPSCRPVACKACLPPPPWLGHGPVAGKANPVTQATLTPIVFGLKKCPSGKGSQANLLIPAAVLWYTTMIWMMVKQKGYKVAAAAARSAKDMQLKALQQEMGLSSDKDGEELAPSTPQKAATWRPVV